MGTHSSILAWRILGQRITEGYSPYGHKELDTAKATEHTHIKCLTLSFLIWLPC